MKEQTITTQEVGVLLPVGLETRFLAPGEDAARPGSPDPNAPGEWRVRLRVTPDEIWLDRHDPYVPEAERLALEAFWEALTTAPDPADPAGSTLRAGDDNGWADAFGRLCAQVGAQRAAWLARTVPVVRPDGSRAAANPQPADAARAGAPTFRGLPARLQVWVRWTDDARDAPAQVIGEIEPVAALVGKPLSAARAVELARWEAAVDAGLAAELPLIGRHPREIVVLGVTGVRPADGTTPEELLLAHADAGRLAVLEPGVPTSTVRGQATAGLGGTAAEWRPQPQTEDPTRTIAALVGPGAAVGPVLASPAAAESERLAELLMGVCFPALWGYGLAGPLGAVTADEIGPLWTWARRWLRPEGNHASLRVSDHVYGVLPVADPAALSGIGPGLGIDGVRPLLPILDRLLQPFVSAAESDSGLVGGGVADAVRTVHRGPVPGGVGWFRSIAVDFHAALTGRPPVAEALREWDQHHNPAVQILGRRPRRRYAARSAETHTLPIPLLWPGMDHADEGPTHDSDVMRALHDIADGKLRDVAFGETRNRHRISLLNERLQLDSLLLGLYARSLSVAGSALEVRWLEHSGQSSPQLPADLLDPVLIGGDGPQVHRHLEELAAHGVPYGISDDDDLVRQLIWLARDAAYELGRWLEEVAHHPERRRPVTRALRSLIEAAAGRWDTWFTALGAARVESAYEQGAMPVLGAYGWVDSPYRGTPGPGPAGFLFAPSQSHAATAAVLRDASVRDADPSLWALDLDSGTVGPAQRMLTDLASGWHLAELTGRMIERRFGDALADDTEARTRGLARLRAAFPLRRDQGAFGCCHGLDVLTAGQDSILAEQAWTEAPPPARDALRDAVTQVAAVLDTASDLQLAEGVHNFLDGQAPRAGAATKALAGALPAGRLDVLDPGRPARSVHTLVLAALPAPAAIPAAAEQGGCAAVAAPGFDAALVARFGRPGAWTIEVHHEGNTTALTLADLGLRPADSVLHSDDSLIALARLVAVRADPGRTVGEVTLPAAVGSARELNRLLRGRSAEADDLQPVRAMSPADQTAVGQARDAARVALQARFDLLSGRAESLAAEIAGQVRAAVEDDEQATRAELEGEAVPDPTGPNDAELAALLLATAAWGVAVPADAAGLLNGDPDARAAARVATLTTLRAAAGDLSSRGAAGRAMLAAGRLVRGAEEPADPHKRADAHAELASATAVAGALAHLVGDTPLPIGMPLPTALLGQALVPARGTRTVTEWLPSIAAVRPRLAEVAQEMAAGASDSPNVYAVDPDDPWRVSALAHAWAARGADGVDPPAAPRLEVVVSAGPPEEIAEWVVLDSFAEAVPDRETTVAAAFDAATPGASPPQAALLVPPRNAEHGLDADALPAAVLLARDLARVRMVDTSTLANARLGLLGSFAALPQHPVGGCPLTPNAPHVRFDDVGFLQPLPSKDDTEDVIAAVTADPLWMLGIQWRLGEHAGEDAASPAEVNSVLHVAGMQEPLREIPVEVVAEGAGDNGTTWDAADLAYAASVGVDGATLTVSRHPGGPLDWWAVTASAATQGTAIEAESVPTRLTWPGAPRRRYWQIEDARRDPAGGGPDVANPATLHILRLLARHGDDWYVVPLPARVGTVVRPGPVTLIDAAGGHWPLQTPKDWRLFAVQGLDPAVPPAPDDVNWHRALPVFASAPTALDGPLEEEVAFAVDEEANLMWAAVLRLGGTATTPHEQPPAPVRTNVPDTGPLHVDWRIADTMPANRFPYLYGAMVAAPAFGAGTDFFVQARMIDPRDGSYLSPPTAAVLAAPPGLATHVLRPLAVPSSGVRIQQQPMLARDVHGRPLRWTRRTLRPLDVGIDVPVRWDALNPRE
jgi:hypothetical protein